MPAMGRIWEVLGRREGILGGVGIDRIVLIYFCWLLRVSVLVGRRRRVVVDCRFYIVGGMAALSTFSKERHDEGIGRTSIEESDI